jgi:hypothetical protein
LEDLLGEGYLEMDTWRWILGEGYLEMEEDNHHPQSPQSQPQNTCLSLSNPHLSSTQ